MKVVRAEQQAWKSHQSMDQFLWAVSQGHISMVKRMWHNATSATKRIYLGGDLVLQRRRDIGNDVRRIPLLLACRYNRLDIVQFLIDHGAEPSQVCLGF